jgi:hypothetical protein
VTARLLARSGAAAVAGAAVAASLSDGWCLFRACTGVACPGCGMTRAAGRLVTGDLAGSFAFHPLLVPMLVVGLVWGLEHLTVRRRGGQGVLGPRLAIALAVAIPVVWLVRAALGALPPV